MYAYAAAHGLSGDTQFLLLNESSIDLAMFEIEDELRKFSIVGKGKCFVLALYDMDRLDASKYKVLKEERED